jgi:3-oxoacyl-[acyl-carrier-protein] synthase II
MHRVVVTGLGVIAPVGNNVRDAWHATVNGRSGIGAVTLFDASSLPVRIGAEVRDFDPAASMDAKEARRASRFIQLAAAAARQAMVDSDLGDVSSSDRYGCIFGVGLGAADDIEAQSLVLRDRGPRKVSPLLMPTSIPNMATGFVSIFERLRGVSLCVSTACASGAHAIGEAYMHVAMGNADAILAGGAESVFTPLVFAGFARMGALSERNDAPLEASRPFDLDRDGFVIGEGAAAIVLENYEHATSRGANIYAELAGYGMSTDAYHITTPAPEGEGAARAMAAALRSAKINPEEVDYINAHGTSTQANDAAESAAIETVFGEHARHLAISSTKGATGHCLGAAGAIEAAFTVLSACTGVVPPTINYKTPDPACRLDYTPNKMRERNIRYAISNSFGFGGQNACLAFKRMKEASPRPIFV